MIKLILVNANKELEVESAYEDTQRNTFSIGISADKLDFTNIGNSFAGNSVIKVNNYDSDSNLKETKIYRDYIKFESIRKTSDSSYTVTLERQKESDRIDAIEESLYDIISTIL